MTYNRCQKCFQADFRHLQLHQTPEQQMVNKNTFKLPPKLKGLKNKTLNLNTNSWRFQICSELVNSPQKMLINRPRQLQFVINHQLQKIKVHFGKKIVKSIKRIYRASENQFSAEKFHQKCDGVTDTLVIAKTSSGKIMAGFTSVPWQSPDNSEYKIDTNQTSFLIDVNTDDKFILKDRENAITNDKANGPIFGFDLTICDKADHIQQSYSRINISYINPKYHEQGNQRSSGSQGDKFKLKEWEVFEVKFC